MNGAANTVLMTVAVAYYCEGAGHATRMMGVLEALQEQGLETTLAGSGPGDRFVELNGYDHFTPCSVDYIDDYQNGSPLKTPFNLYRSAKRTKDFYRWLKQEQPEAVVTDDEHAAIAAYLQRRPVFFIRHDSYRIYQNPVVRHSVRLINSALERISTKFFYPVPWDEETTGNTLQFVPPIAHDPDTDETVPKTDALIVPSAYSESLDTLHNLLESEGYNTQFVGSEDWETAPALLPHIRAADMVICSGYSTVMEAAVAGTPCIIWPETNEQRGMARMIEEKNIPGFTICTSQDAVLSAVTNPPEAVSHKNGVHTIAQTVADYLN